MVSPKRKSSAAVSKIGLILLVKCVENSREDAEDGLKEPSGKVQCLGLGSSSLRVRLR